MRSTDHGAAEGCVLGQDASSFSLCPAARPAMGLCALRAQHDVGALVAGYTVSSGKGAAMRFALFFLRINLLIHSKPSS